MVHQAGLHRFADITRMLFTPGYPCVRSVYISHVRSQPDQTLHLYIADKTPLFYRDAQRIYDSLADGYFLTPIKETLSRLPTVDTFRESHFAEITACIFAEDALSLRKVYSKLSLLTAENTNAHKMDLVLCRPDSTPVEFVFAEVKSSCKSGDDGPPYGHDNSCFAALFTSFNSYNASDLDFDLVAAKDRIDALPQSERDRVRDALKPYSARRITYAGFALIDTSTRDDNETRVLATRRNSKDFDVELICIDRFRALAHDVFDHLSALKQRCSV